jgi:hypothetical protein
MDGVVAPWVRIGLVVLAPAHLVTGLWALLATRSWFDGFPGVGADLVAAEPPFNEHLARDAGAGFLATGVALLVAAALGHRSAVIVALAAYVTFSVPHLAHHAANPPPALSGVAQAVNVVLLSSSVVLALVLAWGTRPVAAPTS